MLLYFVEMNKEQRTKTVKKCRDIVVEELGQMGQGQIGKLGRGGGDLKLGGGGAGTHLATMSAGF